MLQRTFDLVGSGGSRADTRDVQSPGCRSFLGTCATSWHAGNGCPPMRVSHMRCACPAPIPCSSKATCSTACARYCPRGLLVCALGHSPTHACGASDPYGTLRGAHVVPLAFLRSLSCLTAILHMPGWLLVRLHRSSSVLYLPRALPQPRAPRGERTVILHSSRKGELPIHPDRSIGAGKQRQLTIDRGGTT